MIKLIQVVKKNNKHNKQDDLPSVLYEFDYFYECESCAGCPFVEKYGKKCSVSKFKEKSTPYINELINSFVSGKFEIGYSKRFPVSEGINGYLKRKHGTLHLLGHNLHSAMNHLYIKQTVYNLVRFVKLKGTAW